MTTEQIRELTGEEAQRVLQERMMFPTEEDFKSMGIHPRRDLPSMLDRMRDTQRRLKDSNSVEDFLEEQTRTTASHTLIAREAIRLYKSVTAYKSQARVSDYVREMQAHAEGAQTKRFLPDFDSNIFERTRKGFHVGELVTYLRPYATERSGRVMPWLTNTPGYGIQHRDELEWVQNKSEHMNRILGRMKHNGVPVPEPTDDLFKHSRAIREHANNVWLWREEDRSGAGLNLRVTVAKKRPEGQAHSFDMADAFAYAFKVMHWPLRKIVRSRNQREGLYNFKIDGRHTRKQGAQKSAMLSIDEATTRAQARLAENKRSSVKRS